MVYIVISRILNPFYLILFYLILFCVITVLNFSYDPTGTFATSELLEYSSASFLAELSASLPGKLFMFTICKNIFWIEVSKKDFM